MKKKRSIYFQKLFCFASFIFLATCCLWYGGRFIYFYLDNKKEEVLINNNLSYVATSNNELKRANNSQYFYGTEVNNYVEYSNILWRIIKIDNDNSVYLISDNVVTYLSNGDNLYINMWLNKKDDVNNSGILEKKLNDPLKYLLNYNVCDDIVNDVNNLICEDINKNNLIGLLSIIDYINTGGENSFINNGKYTFLNNYNNDNNLWYINDEGKLGISQNDDIYGIKPVIRLNGNLNLISGDGTLLSPYIIEDEKGLFGSYVKLGDDVWRIYDVSEDNIKLILNDYLTVNGNAVTMKYSTTNYYHNDTISTSLAYYMNNDYLNSLSYKDIILDNNWSNYYYSSELGFNYSEVINNKIDTKVSIVSIGDIIFNDNNLKNFYTNTGVGSTSNMIYVINDNGTLSRKRVNYSSNVVPSISVDKKILTKGNGTLNIPYEME